MDFGLESGNKELAEQLVWDYREANLSKEDRALCGYAVKLTLAPGEMSEGDLDVLRDSEWSEEQIVVATQVIGYFNYINRMADALGVDPEDWMTPSREEWLARKGRDY